MSLQLVALLINLGLAVLKFAVGSVAHSRALIADGFNSAGDVFATLVAWLSFRWGLVPPDENHPYGHANAEALAGLLIGGMLCATGGFIFIDGLLAGLAGEATQTPGVLTIYVAAGTAIIKEGLYQASIRIGKRTRSPTLLASAHDHRADVVTSLAALVGILIARSGYGFIDTAAAAVIGIYIAVLGLRPIRDNLGILMHEAPPGLSRRAAAVVRTVPGVIGVGTVRAQPIGGRFRMDLTLEVDGKIAVDAAHDLAHDAEQAILSAVADVMEVHVHVEPASPNRQ